MDEEMMHLHMRIKVDERAALQAQLRTLQQRLDDEAQRLVEQAARRQEKQYREVLKSPENIEAFLAGEETVETIAQRPDSDQEKRQRALEDRLWSRVYGGPDQGRKKDQFRDQLMRGKRR